MARVETIVTGRLVILGLLVKALAAPAQMLVQSAAWDRGPLDLPFISANFPSNNTAGNLIIVAVEIGATAGAIQVVVNDTQGNTYYPATSQVTWRTNGGGSSAQIFYAPNIRGGPNTVTMTEPYGAGNAWNQIAIHEYVGLAPASPLDVWAAATGTTADSPFTISCGPITTTTDGELIFGYGNALNLFPSAGAGFSARQAQVGTSEDLVQGMAGPIVATEMVNASNDPYVMLMAAFKPAPGSLTGPVLPLQADQTVNVLGTLVVTNTAAELDTNLLTTSSILFTYPDRAALMADGWSFVATNPDGTPRDTEVTNGQGVVSYDQEEHPSTLRIPCDVGELLGSANYTWNTLFRDLPSNWRSLRLALSFATVTNYQQANLMVYQNDNNYIRLGFGYNDGLAGYHGDASNGQVVRIIAEADGQFKSAFTATYWYAGGPHTAPATNIHLRLDRVSDSGRINAFASLDGLEWPFVGSFSQQLSNPRLGIWVGGSPVPFTNGLPGCDLQQLDVLTAAPGPVLTYQLLDAPTGASIDLAGLITWTPGPAQCCSNFPFSMVATDNQVPPLAATNNFMVHVVVPPPVLLSMNLTNGSVLLTWSAVPGQNYRVQFKDSHSETNWNDATPDVAASAQTASTSVALDGAPARFYRVLLLP